MPRKICLVFAAVLALAACGGNGDTGGSADPTPSSFDAPFAGAKAYPVFASSEIVVGENRFLVGILNEDDAPIGSAGIEVSLDFYELLTSESEPVFSAETEYLETVPGERGLYLALVTFPRAGKWGAEVKIVGEGLDESVKAGFTVKKEGTTPAVGSPAPRSDTPTADSSKEIAKISTDNDPAPRFYELSVADAVTSGRPSVIVFATPKFCTSQVCAPTLDNVKSISGDFPKVNFVHVEVYSNLDDPSNLKVVPSVEQWGLPSEPWVFVVDAASKIAAKYEGTVTPAELAALLKRF
jgi:hypothetical protein